MPLDLEGLGADFYAGNCHKWLCAPKGAGFLHARAERQELLDPLVVGWGRGETEFALRHDWQSTRDPAAFLAVPEPAVPRSAQEAGSRLTRPGLESGCKKTH